MPDEPKPNKLRDIVYGGFGTLIVLALAWTAGVAVQIRDTVRSLEQYHESEWPLERQLLSIETTQLRSQVAVLRAEIESLAEEVEELQ